MRIKMWTLGIVVGFLGLAGGQAEATEYWTGWISEEAPNNRTYCDWDEGVEGFKCSGSNCDSLALLCIDLPTGMTGDSATDNFTSWFSEEGSDIFTQVGSGFGSGHTGNERYCNSPIPGSGGSYGPALVAGWQCSGSFCDNQKLECVVPVHTSNWSWGNFTNCAWTTTWVSEETGSVWWGGNNKFLVGVRCSGRYCDNKQFYICTIS